MQLVSTVTVGSGGASSIEFTGIPQTGTDLLLVFSGRSDNFGGLGLQFNSDTGGNYANRSLLGTGSSVSSSTFGTNYIRDFVNESGFTANTFSSSAYYIPNYTSAVAKSVSVDGVQENNATQSRQIITAGRWTGTAAITSLKLAEYNGSNLVQHSTASLYIITKA
jgi:hypothetical protein